MLTFPQSAHPMATAETNATRKPLHTGLVKPLGSGSARRRKVIGRLGPWQLLKLLGEGATTRVYLARPVDALADDLGAGAYAVKSLKREWWGDSRAIECQRREAWVGARVSHPNLAPVLSASVAAPPYYVVTPHLIGETLDYRLSHGGEFSLPTALWIVRQTAQALAALHETLGVVHADVKPSNLMVAPDGHTTLIDLGFCQTADEARGWAERPVVGTLGYLAPERVISSTTVDARSDLYSLGVTLYELLAGRPPFVSNTPAGLIAQHRESQPTPICKARPGTPEGVGELISRLLAKNPLRRPASARELADDLIRLEIECFGLK